MKTCRKCSEEKSPSEFNKDCYSKDGLFRNCKLCVRAYNNAYAAMNQKKTRTESAKRTRKYRAQEAVKRGDQPYKKVLCTTCNKKKENQFMYSATKCGPCHRDYMKLHYSEVRMPKRLKFVAWMNGLKAHPCMDCYAEFPPICMDWDHVGEKNFDISVAVNQCVDKEKILAELKNCELVCSNCHRIRTQDRRDGVTKPSPTELTHTHKENN